MRTPTFWTETQGFSPAVLLLWSLLTTMEKLSVNWGSNVYCLHFPAPSKFVCLPACVGTRVEGIWLSFWQLTPSWCCAVLQTTRGPGTKSYETPVGQTEWQCQKRKQESYSDSAFFLLPIIENQTIAPGRPHRFCGTSVSLIRYYKQHVRYKAVTFTCCGKAESIPCCWKESADTGVCKAVLYSAWKKANPVNQSYS